jgi:hypothetical protein
MTIGQIDQMPISEYLGWQEFYALEPWGLRPQDAMHAHAISVLANINRNSEERAEPFCIKDFLLFDDKNKASVEDPRIGGKTCEEWKLLFAAEALAAQRQKSAAQSG